MIKETRAAQKTRIEEYLRPITSVLLLLCSGCSTMASDRLTWLWFTVPFLGFILAGCALVFYLRRSQIAAWDLRLSPQEPSARGIVLWTIGFSGALAVAFAIYNLLLEMDDGQKGLNIGLWSLGTILGTALALYFGLRFAEPHSLPENRRR